MSSRFVTGRVGSTSSIKNEGTRFVEGLIPNTSFQQAFEAQEQGEMKDLMRLEQQGWRALSSPGDAARAFYGSRLADDAVMLFPGGMRIEGKRNILESFASQPWQSFRIEDQAVLTPSESTAIVIYKVTAQRQGSAPYSALVSSTYAFRDGSWLLILHQQTPV